MEVEGRRGENYRQLSHIYQIFWIENIPRSLGVLMAELLMGNICQLLRAGFLPVSAVKIGLVILGIRPRLVLSVREVIHDAIRTTKG